MNLYLQPGFEEHESALSRPTVHVPFEVTKFCEEHKLPLPMLYALIQFSRISGPSESLQAISAFIRWHIEQPNEMWLTTNDIAEMGNFLQFAVDCVLPVESNIYLTYDDQEPRPRKPKNKPSTEIN